MNSLIVGSACVIFLAVFCVSIVLLKEAFLFSFDVLSFIIIILKEAICVAPTLKKTCKNEFTTFDFFR